jgi:hypothetical protein
MLAHHAVDHLTTLMVSNIGNRASIDEAKVCLLTLMDGHDSHLLQQLAEGRCLGKIQLTT